MEAPAGAGGRGVGGAGSERRGKWRGAEWRVVWDDDQELDFECGAGECAVDGGLGWGRGGWCGWRGSL